MATIIYIRNVYGCVVQYLAYGICIYIYALYIYIYIFVYIYILYVHCTLSMSISIYHCVSIFLCRCQWMIHIYIYIYILYWYIISINRLKMPESALISWLWWSVDGGHTCPNFGLDPQPFLPWFQYPRVATPWYQLTIESILGDPYRLGHDAVEVHGQDMWRFAWRSSSVFPWVRGGWRWLCRCRGLFSRGSSPFSPGPLLWEASGGRAIIGRKRASLMRLKFHSRAWQTLGQILIPLQRTETYRSWMSSFPNRNSYINIWTWLNQCLKQTDSEHIVFFFVGGIL